MVMKSKDIIAAVINKCKLKLKGFLNVVKAVIEEIKLVEEHEESGNAELRYISSAKAAVLMQNPKGARFIVWAIFCFICTALIWASWAEIDEYTRGQGRVVPSRYLQVIQNLEGGILSEVYVNEGEEVNSGQPLLRIDDTIFSSSFREQNLKKNHMNIKLMRLQAESSGSEFRLPDKVSSDLSGLFQKELALFASRQKELESSKLVLQGQISQKQQELHELQAKERQISRSYELVDKEVQMTKPLLEAGAISEVEVLRLERQANDLLGELESAGLSIPRLESQLEEAQNKLQGYILSFQSEAHQELNEVSSEYVRISESLQALEDRVERTIVRSPVAGEIKRIMVKTIGGVIQPGMDILEIVPTGDRLLIEARVSPADIAFLHPGQKAVVKVTAYDYAIHGGLDGVLVDISPDTIVDENEGSFYLIKIETKQMGLGEGGAEILPIIPGMTVEAEILTGKKTVLQYLLKPLLRAKNRAFTER